MKLVTFGIDYQKNLIIQFPVSVQPYMQLNLTLYKVKTVPVPILDNSNTVQSYTQLKIEKPYIALNDKMYITICPQELNNCKKIGYEYFCEELFVVKLSKNTVVPVQYISILIKALKKIVTSFIIITKPA